MNAIWLRKDGDGVRLAPLPLPYKHFSTANDPAEAAERRRLAALGSDRPLYASTMIPSEGRLSSRLHTAEAGEVTLQEQTLHVVLDPGLELLDVGVTVERGTIVLVESGARARAKVGAGAVNVLELSVPGWEPSGDPAAEWSPPATPPPPPNYKRMFKAADDRSYFRDFPELLPADGAPTVAERSVVGFWFAKIPAGVFLDWHPEIVNQLVVVLEGSLELEVGGGAGEIQVFERGGAVLAEDRTGEGHIDRMAVDTRALAVVLDDDQLWPVESS
jgi:hypothetical protein